MHSPIHCWGKHTFFPFNSYGAGMNRKCNKTLILK
jgi:hypothetical protein